MNPTTNTEAGAVADVAAKLVRVQLRRTKGWRLPANTVSVSRPGPYGNYAGSTKTDFDRDLAEMSNADRTTMFDKAKLLRGKNLACWCRLDAECHADTWLEMANPRQHLEQGATAGVPELNEHMFGQGSSQ
jgi:hypothetical protein